MSHPISDTYLDVQVARAEAVLAGAGAFDTTPAVMACPGFATVVLFVEYTRAGAGGKVKLKVEGSPQASGAVWHQLSVYGVGAIAAGSDTTSIEQREFIEYGSTGAGKELFMVKVNLHGGIERLRVAAAESGAVGTPGTVKITANFAAEV